MRGISTATLAVLAGCWGQAVAPSEDAGPDARALYPLEVAASITRREPADAALPSIQHFTAVLTPDESGSATLLVGAHGRSSVAPLERIGQWTWRTPEGFEGELLVHERPPEDPCAPWIALRYDAVQLTLIGAGESALGGARGGLPGPASEPSFTALLVGREDTHAALLDVLGAVQDRHPMDVVEVVLDEPIPAGRMVRLVGPAFAVSLQPVTVDGAVDRFVAPRRMLPLGATVRLLVQPELSDFAGNETPVDVTIATFADPGLLADGGFEGDLAGRLDGGATMMGAPGPVPPMGGARSLLVPSDGRFTVRLAAGEGTGSLTFRYRMLYRADLAFPDGFRVQLGSVTTARITSGIVGPPAGALQPTGDPVWVAASRPSVAAIALGDLTAGEAGDVLLDIASAAAPCTTNPPGSQAIVVDDIRFEPAP
jgi:hypothetical protein